MLPENSRNGLRGGPLVWVALAGLAVALALGLVGTLARPAVAAQSMVFSDVNPDHPYYDAIEGLYQAGVIDGYDTPQGKMFGRTRTSCGPSSPR